MSIDVTIKKNFRPGMTVEIIAESDKESQEVTRGTVSKVLSRENHQKGIKVQLKTGQSGRVCHVPTKDEIRLERFKFYNRFFFLPKIYSIWHKTDRHYYLLPYPIANGKEEQTAFLFTEKEGGEELMTLLSLASNEYMVKEINRRKPIVENFKSLPVEVYRINRDKRITQDKLIELENYFKNMR